MMRRALLLGVCAASVGEPSTLTGGCGAGDAPLHFAAVAMAVPRASASGQGAAAREYRALAVALDNHHRAPFCANIARARLWVKTDDDPDSCWDPGSKWFPGVPKFRECFHKRPGCRTD